MAYPDSPYGFIPIRHKSGAPYNGASNPYWIDAADTPGDGLYFIGDAVLVDGTANSSLIEVPGLGSFPPGTLPGVTIATAGTGNKVTGVIVAFGADTRDSTVYRADVTERLVWVCDDPDIVYSVQADAAVAIDDVQRGSLILTDTSGSTSTGRSGMEIDASTMDTGVTDQVLVLRFVNDPLNTANAVGNRLEIIFTLHSMGTLGGIAGI